MFSLCDLCFMLCSRDLNILQMQIIIKAFYLNYPHTQNNHTVVKQGPVWLVISLL